MRDIYIALDNGPTGSVGIIQTNPYKAYFSTVPNFQVQNYTKEKKVISRIDYDELKALLGNWITEGKSAFCLLERPMVNSDRFNASIVAARALESTLIIVEHLKIPYDYIDSRIWQKLMLPKGTKGSTALKQASFDIGLKLFPEYAKQIIYQGDADAILIAEYARRKEM